MRGKLNPALNLAAGAERTGSMRGTDLTLQASFFDFDRDGDADLYLATDKGWCNPPFGHFNHLFENVGGGFLEITAASGTAACIDAMCIAIGDFDANGYSDLYLTNIPEGNALLMNSGGATFTRREHEAGVESSAFPSGLLLGRLRQ